MTAADPSRMRALGVAAVYQQPALLPDLSVAENIALGTEPGHLWRRVDRRGRRRSARESLLDRVGAHTIDVDAPARTLRMAEQQLVEIARAIAARARVLVLDEPTSALPDPDARRLLALVRELSREGVATLYISHRLDEVEALADRVTVLRDGRHVSTDARDRVTREELIRRMVGRDVAAAPPPRAPRPHARVLLAVRGLRSRAGGVEGIDFSVHAGEILGLAGLVGAGRTELARTLFGLTPADAGEITIDARAVRVTDPAQAARLGLAYVPEDRRRHGVIGDMSVAANVSLASLARVSRRGWLDAGRERALARRFVERFAIKAPSVEADVSTLSGGNQQKVALARWLATDPRVLILDEPTQGVDVGAKAEIHRLIGSLAEEGLAILLISSDLPELLALSDRIAVMREGRLLGTLERADATPEAVMALAVGYAARGPVPGAPGAAPSHASSPM